MVSIKACLCLSVLLTVFAAIAQADQNDPALPDLFDELKLAGDAESAGRIEARIWEKWLIAPDEPSRMLSSQVAQAMQRRQLDLALTLANQLVDGSENYAEAWNRRATIHYMLGNDDRSVADIQQTLLLEPRHFGAISGLGLIFLRQGDLKAALKAFEQVLDISPASANAQRSIEQVRNLLGDGI